MIGSLYLIWAAPAVAVAAPPPIVPPKPVTRAEFISRIDAQFAAIDTNHDGKIDRNEMAAAQAKQLEQLNALRLQRLQATFKQLDTNHDGQLSFQEFSAIMSPPRMNETPEQIVQQLDTNRDGKVSADEFRAPQVAAFNKLDANHDGVVTPDEMRAAQQRK